MSGAQLALWDEPAPQAEARVKPELQEIDAETQIFTPPYVAKFLVENSIGRLWMHSHPHSKLADNMGWWVASPTPDSMARVDNPEEIRVLDPACGTGNLLAAAFDLLVGVYQDAGYKAAEIPALILTHNLVGTDIDPAAAEAARAILTAKAHEVDSHFFRRRVVPRVRAWTEADHPGAGLMGTLIRDLDRTKYHVILANPPYMGSKHYGPRLTKLARRDFPDSWRDLCTMFIERGHEMTVPGGMIAMITMESWMFLSSFETMRRRLLAERTILTMAHFGRGVFGRGAVISTTAFVQMSSPVPNWKGVYFRLVDTPPREKQLSLHGAILGYRLGQEQGLHHD